MMLCNFVKMTVRSMVGVRHKSSSEGKKNKEPVTWSTGEYSITKWHKNTSMHKQNRPQKIVYGPYPHTSIGREQQKYPYKLPDGGIQYYGFTYYPRNPEFVEKDDYTPSPLHLVTLIHTLHGQPYWLCEMLKQFKLEKRGKVAIVKNIPENNRRLHRVKHLVKIIPIKLPTNLPDDVDPEKLFLKEDGELVYNPAIAVYYKQLECDPELKARKWTHYFIDKEVRKRWFHPLRQKLE